MENKKVYQFYALSAADTPLEYRYVGVTTKQINERFSQHKYCAMHDEKRSLPVHKWMYSVYKNGGNIIFTKIDECEEDSWESREQQLISDYSKKYKLLNLDKGESGVITKEKREKSGLQRSAEGHYKKIVLFDNVGNVVDICESVNSAVEKYGLSRTSIGNVLSGRSKTCGGYYIVTHETYIQEGFNIKEFINNLNSSGLKKVYQFDLNGTRLAVYDSISKIVSELGYDKGAISRAIKNKKIYKDCYWSNSIDIDIAMFEKLYKYKLGNTLYKTHKELGDAVGLAECTISNKIKNNSPINGEVIEIL